MSGRGNRHNQNNGKFKPSQQKNANRDGNGQAKNHHGSKNHNNNIQKQQGNNKNNKNKKNQKTHRSASGDQRNNNNSTNQQDSRNNNNSFEPYPPHWSVEQCEQSLDLLTEKKASTPTNLTKAALGRVVRGKLRVLPGNPDKSPGFVRDDRGHIITDICILNAHARNRALDGDIVYVQLLENEQDGEAREIKNNANALGPKEEVDDDDAGDEIFLNSAAISSEDAEECESAGDEPVMMWQDDPLQMSLWSPTVVIPRSRKRSSTGDSPPAATEVQKQGRVVAVVPPKRYGSELKDDSPSEKLPTRRLVGSLKLLSSGNILLIPLNKSLPHFLCPADFGREIQQKSTAQANSSKQKEENVDEEERVLYSAIYEYGSWKGNHRWPPCQKVERIGDFCLVEDEIYALLLENGVDHGDFDAAVLKHVDETVQSGLFRQPDGTMGWKPTPAMYHKRRDYREQRIFTIDPTTAKDLDDALHITPLPNNQFEIGVHIADVSHFVKPHTVVDKEAQRRATTVYLVDRTIPMLPRPLCEIACSLNENVERLAFSCVWRMNLDGTLVKDAPIWYGRTVIRSCARLDYATAQNIIDGKAGDTNDDAVVSEEVWPSSRRPTNGFTMTQVAEDVRLMHKVAMGRRRLRFDNGALSLSGIKLTFKLDDDGQTPLLAAPYPIRDSNRLIEEYMLIANYLVAQRLITHATDRAVLRHHPEPLDEGLEQVAAIAKASIGFNIDISTSQTLQASLRRLRQQCQQPGADPLVLQTVTQMIMTPMQPADYFAAGMMQPPELWKHFALNIPYYTHFTSPIRRYADVLVHRLLQATLDDTVDQCQPERELHDLCVHCNEKRMASKTAQERCDRVFLSLFVRKHPMQHEMGVVLSLGKSSFTVFVPSVGASVLLYLEEHKELLTYERLGDDDDDLCRRSIRLNNTTQDPAWRTLEIKLFVKLAVTVYCRDKPPIDIKVRLEGPWLDS